MVKIYTPQEAEARVHTVIKLIAREALDAMILLDAYSLHHPEVVEKMFSLQGYANHMIELCYYVWRQPLKDRIAARKKGK